MNDEHYDYDYVYDCDKCANKGCWCCLECQKQGWYFIAIKEDKNNAE